MLDVSLKPIIENMVWSFSRVKAFEFCPYSWYLRYILKYRPKDLFFSSYGSFVHKILEMYYKGELDKSQLLQYYLTNFKENVPAPAPNTKVFNRYFYDGVEYFKTFEPLEYEPVGIEEKIDGNIDGIRFIGVVDYRSEDDSGIVIIDNKSKALKPRSKKLKPLASDIELDEYQRQLYLYGKILNEQHGRPVSHLGFNCFRCKPPLIMEEFSQERSDRAVQWLKDNVGRIANEENFDPEMDFFKCKNLCDMQEYCEYYNMNWGGRNRR